jgi:hypothetical protein
MKKLVGLTLAAALVAMLPQQASAWTNFKFGVGLGVEWSTGNNSWFCGKLYNNGDHNCGPSCGPMGFDPMAYGYGGHGGDFGYAYGGPMMSPHAPAQAPAAPPAPQKNNNTASLAQSYSNDPYQPVSYQYPNYYYPSANYYYPSANYYYPPANNYYYTGYYGW